MAARRRGYFKRRQELAPLSNFCGSIRGETYMIMVDSALQKRHQEDNPIRVALIGSGYMGRGIALEIITSIVGMKLVAVCNRTLSVAQETYRQAGVDSVKVVHSTV